MTGPDDFSGLCSVFPFPFPMFRYLRHFRLSVFRPMVSWTMIGTLVCYTVLPQIGLCFCANCGCAVNFARNTESAGLNDAEKSTDAKNSACCTHEKEKETPPKSCCCTKPPASCCSSEERSAPDRISQTKDGEDFGNTACGCKGRCSSCPGGGGDCSCSVKTSELAITTSTAGFGNMSVELPALPLANFSTITFLFPAPPDVGRQYSPNIVLPRLHLLLLVWRN